MQFSIIITFYISVALAVNTPFRAGRAWSKSEHNTLVEEIRNRKPISQIAMDHQRTYTAITSRVMNVLYPKGILSEPSALVKTEEWVSRNPSIATSCTLSDDEFKDEEIDMIFFENSENVLLHLNPFDPSMDVRPLTQILQHYSKSGATSSIGLEDIDSELTRRVPDLKSKEPQHYFVNQKFLETLADVLQMRSVTHL